MHLPKELHETYSISDDLGEDSLGKLLRVKNKSNDTMHLMRLMRISGNDRLLSAEMNSDLALWADLHYHSVSFIREFLDINDSHIAVIMDNRPGIRLSTVWNDMLRKVSDADTFIQEIGSGIEYMHLNGIRHLFVNPDTILIDTRDGSRAFYLTDCGLLEFLEWTTRFNLPKPDDFPALEFMSPEFVSGERSDLRSDLYSFGTVIYQLLTGINPFQSDTATATISAHLNRLINQPKDLNSEISDKLNMSVMKLLEKNPGYRPSSLIKHFGITFESDDSQEVHYSLLNSYSIDHPLPLQEIRSAFEKACNGSGSVLVLVGDTGIGKSRLLEGVESEFRLSGVNPIIIQAFPNSDTECGCGVLRSVFKALHHFYPKLEPDVIDQMYPPDFEKNYLQISDALFQEAVLQSCARHILKAIFDRIQGDQAVPCVVILKDCFFSDSIFWGFFRTLARLLSEKAIGNVPCLWLVETRDIESGFIRVKGNDAIKPIELVTCNRETVIKILASGFGLESVPEMLTDWVMELSEGNFQTIDQMITMLRYTGILSLKDDIYTINDNTWHTVRTHCKDLNQFTDYVIDHYMTPPMRLVLTHLSLWPHGCSLINLSLTMDLDTSTRKFFHWLLFSEWVRKTRVEGSFIYKIRYPVLQERFLRATPDYQKSRWHQRIADQLCDRQGALSTIVAEHYFSADNRLHGCEHALSAAMHYRDRQCLEKSRFWFTRILESMPERNRTKITQISFEYAKVLIADKDFSKAHVTLSQAESFLESRFHHKRDKADYLLLRGICSFHLEDNNQAVSFLLDALKMLPRTTAHEYRLKILFFLAQICEKLNDFEGLIVHFTNLQKLLPLRNYPFFAGRLLGIVERAYQELQQYTTAEFYLKESILFGETTGDHIFLLNQNLRLGQIYERTGKYRLASESYDRVIRLSRKYVHSRLLCDGLCHLANLHMLYSQQELAQGLLAEALQLSEKLNEQRLYVWSSFLLSSVFIQKGLLDEANSILSALIPGTLVGIEITLIGRIYLNKARIAERRGQFYLMLQLFTELLSQVRIQNQRILTAFSHLYIARVHTLLEQLPQAKSALGEARKILDNSDLSIPDCNILEATIYLMQHNPKKARKLAMEAIDQSKEKNLIHQQAEASRVLGLIDQAENNQEGAILHFQTALAYFISDQEEFEAAHIHRLLAKAYSFLSKHDLAKQEDQAADALFKKLSAFYYLSGDAGTESPRQENEHPDVIASISSGLVVHLLQSLYSFEAACSAILHIVLQSGGFDQGAVFQTGSGSANLSLIADISMTADDQKTAQKLCKAWIQECNTILPVCRMEDSALFPDQASVTQVCYLPVLMDKSLVAIMFLTSRDPILKKRVRLFSELISIAFEIIRDLETAHINIDHEVPESRVHSSKLVAESAEMSRIKVALYSIAASKLPVLITGESGTGKSFLAEYIHRIAYQGRTAPAVIQCSTLNSSSKSQALTSVIDGMLATGFSTTITSKTVIIEDIDLLSLTQQMELIPILQPDRRYPLLQTNLRFIFTTACNIRQSVQESSFSEELYRLIAEIQLKMPNLASRKEDIPQLARVFLEEAVELTHKKFTYFHPDTLDALMSYPWPANVIELKHALETAVLFGTPPEIHVRDLPKEIRSYLERAGIMGIDTPVLRSIEDIEEAHIRSILHGTKGNKLRACELLGISRPTLDRKLEKFGIIISKKRKR
ncbi:sigma 54-interacting transcriptional regulator [bacterium]|nr:sigma 54-interacting transcriptional regulator [candidate division CSSED10-310 bacterium]